MPSHSRAHFGLAVAGAVGLIRFPAGAAEFNYKLAHDSPAGHPMTIRAQEAADKIFHDSGGRIEIKIFPNSLLGTGSQVLGQARIGALELLLSGDNIMQTVVPAVGISAVPFAFATYRDAWNAVDGPLGAYTRNAIAKGTTLHPFGRAWDEGFRQLVNNVRPIVEPDDLRGLKMRTPPSSVAVALYKAFGASVTPIQGGAEIYTALQTHLVDGLDQALVGVENFKFYEVQKYVSISNHIWTGVTMVASADAWQRLPPRLQELVERTFDAAAALQRPDMMRADQTFEVTLKGHGMTFSEPDLPAFKNVIRNAGLYTQWRDGFGTGPWSLLEKAVGKLP